MYYSFPRLAPTPIENAHIIGRLVEGGVRSRGGDSARSVGLVDVLGDTDVSALSPGGRPRVLDLPVVGSIVSSVSDSQDTVVEAGARGVGHDPALVQLPVDVGVNGDRHGLDRDGSGKGRLSVGKVSVGDAGGAGNLGAGGHALGGGAGARGVRVGRFSAKAVGGNVLEGVVHQTAVATLVAVGGVASNQLLLRERDGRAVLEVVSTLHAAGGGERPKERERGEEYREKES